MTESARDEVRWERRPGFGIGGTLLVLGLVVAALVILLHVVAWIPVRQAREAFRAGRNAQSIEIGGRWSGLIVWEAQFHQILAAAYLTGGMPHAARPHLEQLKEESALWFSALPKDLVAEKLFARGRYREFLEYDAAVRERRPGAQAAFHRAAAEVAVGRITAAEQTLGSVDRDEVPAERFSFLEAALAARKRGIWPVVYDRRGKPVAAYHAKQRDLVPARDEFASLVDASGGPFALERHLARVGTSDALITTLDTTVQRAALAALGDYRGSLVAIDPKTSRILAIASRGEGENLAFRQYEPGSIVKVLTAMNALSSGVDVESMFPYECSGALTIDGRRFGDWKPEGHGTLETLDEAMAQSCNVVFADLGVRIGAERLQRLMRAAGFDAQLSLQLFRAPLGKIVPPIYNRFETAFLAIGLKHETSNAVHVAMLASMLANRGRLTAPELLLDRRTIIGESSMVQRRPSSQQVVTREVAERVIRTMQAVVTDPNGTGRNAAVQGVSIAMKTGTAGTREGGLDAVILAFAPVDDPVIAFGVIAENAGSAEIAGAEIARRFITAVVPSAPARAGSSR